MVHRPCPGRIAISILALGIPAFATAASGSGADAGVEAGPGESAGHMSYSVGARRLGSGWGPAQANFVFGLLDFDARGPDWPVSFAGRLTLGYSPNVPEGAPAGADYSGTWEFDLGIRKIWGRSASVEPFIGGGLAVIGASTSSGFASSYGGSFYEQSARDTTAGPYIEAGTYWSVSSRCVMGILGSYSRGELQLGEASVDAGGFSALILIGGRMDLRRRAAPPTPAP